MTAITATPGYQSIREQYNIAADACDKWGNAMEWHYAVAEVLYHADEDIPVNWEFEHSSLCDGTNLSKDYATDVLLDGLDYDHWDIEDVRTFGDVLHRYENILELAGKRY